MKSESWVNCVPHHRFGPAGNKHNGAFLLAGGTRDTLIPLWCVWIWDYIFGEAKLTTPLCITSAARLSSPHIKGSLLIDHWAKQPRRRRSRVVVVKWMWITVIDWIWRNGVCLNFRCVAGRRRAVHVWGWEPVRKHQERSQDQSHRTG